MPNIRNTEKNLWENVTNYGDLSKCWEWQGYTVDGYGQMRFNGRYVKTHRLAYKLLIGDLGDFLVCHSCDNRICCNPDHLWLGTHEDNMQDMVKKGRQRRGDNHPFRLNPELGKRIVKFGEDNPQAKLTEKQAIDIIGFSKSFGLKYRWIAQCFEVEAEQIRRIVKGDRWPHIQDKIEFIDVAKRSVTSV